MAGAADGGAVADPGTEAGAAAAEAVRQVMEMKDRGLELYKKGLLVEARGAWEEALDGVSEEFASELRRVVLSLRLNLTQVALTLKEYEQAVTHATSALDLEPENSKALFRRGTALDALGRLEDAVRDLLNAAKLEPRSAEIRRSYDECKKRLQEQRDKEDEDVPAVHDLSALPRAFLDIGIGDASPRRLEFALYTDTVPRTAENFRALCAGTHDGLTARGKEFSYKGSVLHRMIPGLMVQGGDFENANGTGGESIYGRRFEDESFKDKVTRRGLLCMANDGPNTNGSNFFVSLNAAEHLDRKHVVFGEVVSDRRNCLLDELEALQTDAEMRPLVDVVVVECGVC